MHLYFLVLLQCGKELATIGYLRKHILRAHSSSSDRPFPCPDCDRTFATNFEMKAHRIMAHLKTRPFACRFPGCPVAYNDASSRGCHEVKKHGSTYPKAVKAGRMPPLEDKQEPQQQIVHPVQMQQQAIAQIQQIS